MKKVKTFQIRGVKESVNRVDFNGRLVDFWSPEKTSEHLLVAHDGQNVFGRDTIAHRRTWKIVQAAIRVSNELGITPPVIVGVFHSRSPQNPWGRILDLAPQDPFQNGVEAVDANDEISLDELQGNSYLEQITTQIVPAIAREIDLNTDSGNKAVIGSSMGGLASLYALAKRPDFFTTSLALSPHWTAGNEPLVDAIIDSLPTPGTHKVWMSRGTRGYDAGYGPYQDYADAKMVKAGWREGKDFSSKIYNKSGHNERSWAKYLDEPMRFWLEN